MAYVALYRSYRPTKFSEVVGQTHVIKTLKNAVMESKTSHAYIFSGLRGIGKTTIARILAKAVNCEHPIDGEPCNACKNCLAIINDETTDIVELDAASNNGVDEMRDILEKVNFLPSRLKKKVYIIDEAHMLSSAAFNALLKTLEEPPLYAMFVLATTEPHKIPQTILSRCQRFDFKQLSNEELIYQLKLVCEKEQIEIDEEAIYAISESAEGGMRDALSILDQASVYAEAKIKIEDVDNVTGRISKYKLIELVTALKEKNANKAIHLTNELINMGKEASRIVGGLIQFCRDLLLYKNVTEFSSKKSIYNNEKFQNLADSLNEKEIFYYIDVLVDIQNKIKFTNSQNIYIEVGLLKIVNSAEDDIDILGKIQKIESQLGTNEYPNSYGNSDIDVKLTNIENKIKKVSIDLERADLENFKEKMESKMDLIEDVSSKNATLPTDVTRRLDSIEDRLRILNIDVQGTNQEEVKEFIHKVQELESKIQEKALFALEENNENAKDSQDVDIILEQLVQLENKMHTIEEKMEEPKENICTNEEFIHLSRQVGEMKEQISQLEKEQTVIPQSLPLDTNIEHENILQEVEKLKEQIKDIEEKKKIYEESQSTPNDRTMEIVEEMNLLKEQLKEVQSKNSNTNVDISTTIEERMKNLEEFLELLSQKVDEIGPSVVDKDCLSEISELKENYFSIVGKLQEVVENNPKESFVEFTEKIENIQKDASALEEKIKLLEGKISVIEQKDIAQDEQIHLIKEGMLNQNMPSPSTIKTTNPSTPVVNNQSYVRPVEQPKIVETNETRTLQTVKNVYDVRIVERILHESRELECREEKGRLVSAWPKLEDKVGYVLSPIAKILLDGKLVANGKKELLIVYPSATICNHIMEPKNYIDAKQVLRITFGKDYEFLALPENTWQEKRTEYIGQHSIGIRYPKLTPIKNPELKVIIPNYEEINQKQKRPLQQAKSFFGGAFVEEEKE